MSSSTVPPDKSEYYTDQLDEIRYGRSLSGNVPAGSADDLADRGGLPRPDHCQDGVEHIHAEHDAAQRWHPLRGASEFDPVKSGTPSPGFRATMAPVSNPKGSVTRQPRPRRPVVNWIP